MTDIGVHRDPPEVPTRQKSPKDQQEAWQRAVKKLIETLDHLYKQLESWPKADATWKPGIIKQVNRDIDILDQVVPIFAKLDDVPCKNIAERWPNFKEAWARLLNNRGDWNNAIAGVTFIRGYAIVLPPSPPGTRTDINS
jgi:hypothetical protein